MCLAVPMQLVARADDQGEVERDGVRVQVSLSLLPEAGVGDWILVHAGYAMARVDEAEVAETLAWIAEMAKEPGT